MLRVAVLMFAGCILNFMITGSLKFFIVLFHCINAQTVRKMSDKYSCGEKNVGTFWYTIFLPQGLKFEFKTQNLDVVLNQSKIWISHKLMTHPYENRDLSIA